MTHGDYQVLEREARRAAHDAPDDPQAAARLNAIFVALDNNGCARDLGYEDAADFAQRVLQLPPYRIVPIADVVRREPFTSLFALDPEVVEAMRRDMEEAKRYDPYPPILVWRDPDGNRVLVDGHQRVEAAIAAGLETIHTVEVDATDETDALLHAYRTQAQRRQSSPAELMAIIASVEAKIKRDIASGLIQQDGRINAMVAKAIGVSATTVKRAIQVSRDPEMAQKVSEGVLSPRVAADLLAERRKEARAAAEAAAPPSPPPAPKEASLVAAGEFNVYCPDESWPVTFRGSFVEGDDPSLDTVLLRILDANGDTVRTAKHKSMSSARRAVRAYIAHLRETGVIAGGQR